MNIKNTCISKAKEPHPIFVSSLFIFFSNLMKMMTRSAKRKLQEEDESQTESKCRKGVKEESNLEISAQLAKVDELVKTESQEIKENGKMCISFSNFPDEFKEECVRFFESKGVQTSVSITNSTFDPKTTHMVAQKMSRSEKMLGSIVSGKWILHPSYVEACFAANEILSNFTDFEWGNPKEDFMQEITTENEQTLAKTAFRLRQTLEKQTNKGLFTGLRAIIHTTENRKGAFARLILAGKGIVIENVKPPYIDAKEATHCLAELHKLPNQILNFEALAKQQVAVVRTIFLNEFLTTGSSPNVEKFLVDEYKPAYRKHYVFLPPFLPINDICERYPHVGEIIFNYLDDKSLQQSREVCKTWSKFLDLKPFYWTRMMKNHIGEQERFSDDWNRFFNKVTVEIAKKYALYIVKLHKGFFEVARSPLHIASKMRSLAIFEYVYGKVMEKNPRGYGGRVPLHVAVNHNNFGICKFICEKGNRLGLRSDNGNTPLHTAARKGHFVIFKYLFQWVEVKNPVGYRGMTPIHQAAAKGHFEIFKFIYERTEEKNLQDIRGWTPIHHAAKTGQLEICKFIHEKGNNLNPQAIDGTTPLTMAADNGHFEVTRFIFGVVKQTLTEAEKARIVSSLKSQMNDGILIKLIKSFLE